MDPLPSCSISPLADGTHQLALIPKHRATLVALDVFHRRVGPFHSLSWTAYTLGRYVAARSMP